LSMWHEADDEAGMEARTSSLMTKFGIMSIPALVLMDKQGGLICADARDKCVADPDGWAFPWPQQTRFPQAAEMGARADTVQLAEVMREGHPPPVTQARAPGGAARGGPLVNFDLPPRARLQLEPTCARPQAFARGVAVGVPVGSRVMMPGGQTPTSTRGTALGFSVRLPVGKRVGLAINPGREAPSRDTIAGVQAKKGKRKSPPSDEVMGPPLSPKPNFGVCPGPHGQMSGPTEGMDTRGGPPMAEIVHLRNMAWEVIGTATVDRTKCDRYWRAWTGHCRLYPKDHGSGPTASKTTDQLLMFAVAMREGQYGLGDQVKVQSVERALRHVAQRLILDRHPDP
jgi:hypothetical protein